MSAWPGGKTRSSAVPRGNEWRGVCRIQVHRGQDYLRDRREGKGGASLGGLQPRNVWFRGCGGIWRGAGYRCTISIFCPKRHSNYTVKCSWELVLFLRLKLVRGDSYREMNTTLQFCRPVATGRKFYPPSRKFPKNPSSGGCWQHLEQKYLLGPKMYPGS